MISNSRRLFRPHATTKIEKPTGLIRVAVACLIIGYVVGAVL